PPPTPSSPLFPYTTLFRSESRATRALALIEKVLGSDHPALAEPLTALATTHLFEGRAAQAESMARKLVTVTERALGPNHLAVAKDRKSTRLNSSHEWISYA